MIDRCDKIKSIKGKAQRLFCDFLLSSTDKELQKNYNILLDAVLKEADKCRK